MAAGVADISTPVVLANSVVLFGTSLEAQNLSGADVTDPAIDTYLNARGWFHWCNAFCGDSFRLVRNAGIGGNTYAQMRARIDADVVAYASDWVFMGGPVNDIAGGRTAAAIIADLDAMLDTLSGRLVLLLTAGPSSSYDTTSKLGVLYDVNRYIARLPQARSNVVVADVYQALSDPATGAPATGMATDAVHFSNAGALLVGKTAAAAVQGRYVAVPPRVSAANDPRSVIGNPLFTSGTGWAALGHGVSGSSVVPSYPARADGYGNVASVAISGVTVDDSYGVQYVENISGGRFVVGDVIWAEATLEWSGAVPLGIASLLGPRLRLFTRLSGGTFDDQLTVPTMASVDKRTPARFPAAGVVRLRTPRITVSSGVDRIYVGGALVGAASATLVVRDLAVMKV